MSYQSIPQSSIPLATSLVTSKTQTYYFANACDLEIYCSPFGVSALYVNIRESGIVGIGSTMGRITGQTKGKVYYNNSDDFRKKKFKIHGLVDANNCLRIDFYKIFKDEDGGNDQSATSASASANASASGSVSSGSPLYNSTNKASNATPGSSTEVKSVEDDLEVPDIIFVGPCPICRPEKVDPFIGVFSFEMED